MPGYGWSCPVIPGTFGRHGRRGSNLWSASSSPVVFHAAIGGGWNPRDRKRTRVKTARGGAPPTRNRRGVRDAPREPVHGETPAGPMPMTLATGPRRGAPGAGRPCHRWLPPVLSPARAGAGAERAPGACVTGGCPVRPVGRTTRRTAEPRRRPCHRRLPRPAGGTRVPPRGGGEPIARRRPDSAAPRRLRRGFHHRWPFTSDPEAARSPEAAARPHLARGLYCVPDMCPNRTGRGNPNGSACERTLLQS